MSLQVKVRPRELTSVLSQVVKAAGHRLIPIISAVRIQDHGQGVDVAATDTQVYIQRRVPAVVTGQGTVCVSARHLTQILRLVPKTVDWITLEDTGDEKTPSVKVSWGNSEYVLVGFPPNMFPTKPDWDGPCDMVLIVQTDKLHTLLKRTVWAAGTNESKPWLTGINLSMGEDRARSMATDGVCIGWADCDVTITGGTTHSVSRIIPLETVKHLINLLPTVAEAAIQIIVFEQQIFVDAGDLQVISNCLQGAYPDIMRLVPSQYPYTTVAPREELLGVIKRLAVVAKDGAFKITIQPGQDTVVTAATPELGQAAERMPNITADWSMTTGFQSKFFLNFLPLWCTPAIKCEFSNPRNPVRFSPATGDDYGAVVLPLIDYP